MLSQNRILNKILSTKDFSIISLNNLTDKYFFNYAAEFNFIVNHYKAYNVVPDKVTFINTFPNFEIQEVTEPVTYLLEELFKDYNASYLATRFNTIKKMLEADKTSEAVDYFMKSTEQLHSGKVLSCIDLMSDTSRYDHYLEKTADARKYYLSTGFPELDTLIGGIDRLNENAVIAARSGIGKSWILIKMAVAASLQGLTVGIYSGEIHEDLVGYRVDTLLGHIKNMSITRGDLYVQREYEQYIKSLAMNNYGPIKVLTPPMTNGPATVATLQTFIEKEHLDILLIDQYSLLEDTSHAKAFFERVANISKDIKNTQVKYRIPIISVAQMNRTKNEDGSQDTTQIGLSDRIPQDATLLLMLDRKDDQLTLNIVKARNGGDGHKLVYQCDWNIGKFTYIPSEGDSISQNTDFDAIQNYYEDSYTSEEFN